MIRGVVLLVCTGDRVVRLEGGEDGWRRSEALPEAGAQCLALDPADPEHVLVGCRGAGVRESRDGGRGWRDAGLAEPDVFSVAVSAADGAVYAGTEPSRLFRRADADGGWQELAGLQEIPSRPSWSFPPRPWTSHVRAIAVDPRRPERLLVGIELGGLMRSGDAGTTWSDHRPGAQRDVHALAWHPRAPDRAYEAGGGGAAWSRDGGATWEPADAGREHRYCWALAADPEDPEVWFVSAASGPRTAHGGGSTQVGLYRWEGAGPWRRLSGGLPEPLDAMPYALATARAGLVTGLRDGRLFLSPDRGESWRALPPAAAPIVALAAY